MSNTTKERPIIFNAQEVNAVLASDKTQHRIVLPSQPYTNKHGWQVLEIGGVRISDQCVTTSPLDEAIKKRLPASNAAPYRVGDRLWVQEPTHTANSWDWFYDATHSLVECKEPYTPSDLYLPWDDDHQEYTGPIGAEHMPYWASRILLEITDIRIERVQDISEDDAIAEGVKPIHKNPVDSVGPNHFTISNGGYRCSKPKASDVFKEMYKVSDDYDKHGENPWVWVIEFKIVEPSEVKL